MKINLAIFQNYLIFQFNRILTINSIIFRNLPINYIYISFFKIMDNLNNKYKLVHK